MTVKPRAGAALNSRQLPGLKIVSVDTPAAAAAAASPDDAAEAEWEQSQAEVNLSVGWIPVVGTAINAAYLASDFLDFTIAALNGDTANMGDEIGDMAVDLVGTIPIVGGPLAAVLHQLRVGATPVNHAPVVGDSGVTVTGIDTSTGRVTGLVNVVDPDGDQLTYKLGTPPDAAVGTVTVDSATGEFIYTPTPQARFGAWTTPGEATATFTVNASDGEYSIPVTVTAPISPSAAFTVNVLASSDHEELGNQGLAVTPDGHFYSTTYQFDTAGNVVVLNPDGTYARTVDIASVIPAAFSTAYDIAVGPGGRVFVSSETGSTAADIAAETGHGAIVVIDPADGYTASLFAQTTDPASALVVDPTGNVYVANWNNDDISVFNADGSLNHVISSDLLTDGDDTGVAGMALGAGGQLYLTKPALGVIKEVNAVGSLVNTLEVGGTPWSIAFGSNGATYVTDAGNGTVGVLDADGDVIRTISLPQGSNPTDLTIGADGTVYVSYTDVDGAAIAAITAVPIPESDPTVLGQDIPGLPAGSGGSGGLVVAGDVVYQTVTGTDPATGKPTTTVEVITADGTTTFAHVDGAATGPVVVGADGVAYQTVTTRDATTGAAQTGVLVISPSGASTFTGLFAGSPAGSVLTGANGTGYQVLSLANADSTSTTTILTITSTGVTTHDIAGAPAAVTPDTAGGVIGPDGTAYVTTVDYDADNSKVTTYVAALTKTGMKTYAIAGYATGPVAVTANGTVYQTIAVDPGTDEYTFGTAIAVLNGTGFVTLPGTIPGLPLGSPQVAAGGALYQATMVVDADTGSTTTTIAKITGSGLAAVMAGLPGTPFGADGKLLPVVVGSDGNLYQTTVGEPDPDTGAVTTSVTTKSPDGSVDTAQISGQPVGAVVVGPNGVAFQTTYDSGAGITRVAAFTAGGTTVREFDGYPGDPGVGDLGIGAVVIGADGNAYQTVAVNDLVTGKYNTLVAVIAPSDVQTHVYAGVPSGPAVVGADDTVYQSVSQFDVTTQTTYTTVLAVTASGMTPVSAPIVGQAVGSVVAGSDGLLYQTVYTEGGAGEYLTAAHLIDPGALSMARSAAALAVQAAATNNLILVGDPISVGGDPEGIAVSPDGRYVYVANEDGYLSVIDTHDNNSIRTVYTGSDSLSVAVRGNFVYVSNRGSDSVSVIDMSNIANPAVRPVAVNVQVGNAPFGLAVTPNGKYVYVANTGDGTLSVIDTHSSTVVGDPIEIGGTPYAVEVSPNGTRVYVADSDGWVSVIDTSTNTVKYTVPVGSYPYGLAVSPDNKTVYVTNFSSSTVSVIDVDSGTVSSVSEGNGPEYVTVSPSGNRVYVTNTSSGTVSVIDAGTNTVIGDPIQVGYVAGVALSPNSQRLYAVLAGGGGSSVQVIATGDSGIATNTSTKTPPQSAAVTPHLDEDAYGVTGYLLERVLKQEPNGIGIDITTDTSGKKRVVAFINGTGSQWWSQARNAVAIAGIPDPNYVVNVAKIQAASLAAMSWNNLFPEVMLVGYSQGGMDVQNIAAYNPTGLNITTVVTFASPINQIDNHATVHIQELEDFVPLIAQLDKSHIFTASTGLPVPPDTNPLKVGDWANWPTHNPGRTNSDGKKAPAYLTVANDFDKSTDSKFDAVKKNIVKFVGGGVSSVTVIGAHGL
jgi:YVTN family beta-propeller protein/VCBS repeat-containing protein